MSQFDFDVGIIGGGPAGATTASYLAKAGLRCVVLERENFPRPHVGESLVPSSMRIFSELGLIEQLEEARFPRKYGAVWTTAEKVPLNYDHDWEGLEPCLHGADVRFEERKQQGVDRNYTYHVDRSKFDLLLLKNAERLGANVFQGVNVTGVDFSNAARPQIHFLMGKNKVDLNVRMVVDASGRNTFLGSKLNLKVKDCVFDQFAIHAWFKDYNRDILASNEIQNDYIFIHFLPLENTWVWQIPITDTVTSIGIVSQRSSFKKSNLSYEDYFWNSIRTRDKFYQTLNAATQIRPFSVEGDYSYAMSEITGNNFLLVGDAARFVDPIFSSGVSIALTGARLASMDIINAAEKNDFRKASFATYQETIRRGTKNWYKFITLYYRLNVLFTFFLRDKRYRIDVLKLLQGDLYDEDEPAVLQAMRNIVEEVEADEYHPWHPLLGSLKTEVLSAAF